MAYCHFFSGHLFAEDKVAVDGVLPFLLRTPVRRGHDVPRRFLLVVLGLP